MRRRFRRGGRAVTVLSAVLLAMLGCRTPGGDRAAPASEDARAVRAVAESWDPMLNSANLDGLVSLMAEDVVRMNPGAAPLVGRGAVRADFQAAFETVTFDAADNVTEVHADGDWGFAFGAYEDHPTRKRTGVATAELGKWVSVFRRTSGGFKYAVDIWNRDKRTPHARGPADDGSGEGDGLDAATSGLDSRPGSPDVRAAVSMWDEKYNAGDVDAVANLYASDAHRMNDGELERVGREAIRAGLKDELATATFDQHSAVHGLAADGEWAYAWGTWAQMRTDKETREKTNDHGNWLFVFRRSGNGWKIYLDIWNRGA